MFKISVQLIATCKPLRMISYTSMNVPNRKQPSSLSKLILGLFSSLVSLKRQWVSQCLMFQCQWFFFLSQFLIPFLAFHDAFCFFFSLIFFNLSAKSTELFSAPSNTETDWRADWPPRFKLVFNCWKCALPAHCFGQLNPWWPPYTSSSNLLLPH